VRTVEATVVIPSRDRPRTLRLAVRSALAQPEVAIEVIVVDDGSYHSLEPAGELSDPRVRVVKNEVSRGVGTARNRGIAEAQSGWIAFLDDDDLWAPRKLRLQLDALRATGRRWAYGGEVIIDPNLRVVGGSPPPPPEVVVADLNHYDAVPAGASNVVVAADLLRSIGPFDPDLTTSEDWDMWIRLARTGPPACVERPVVAIRHGGVSSRERLTLLAELHTVARRHGIDVDWPRHYRWAAWEALLSNRRWEAVRHYRSAIAAGDWTSLARTVVAILGPRVGTLRQRPNPATASWRAEAESWIRTLRSNQEAP